MGNKASSSPSASQHRASAGTSASSSAHGGAQQQQSSFRDQALSAALGNDRASMSAVSARSGAATAAGGGGGGGGNAEGQAAAAAAAAAADDAYDEDMSYLQMAKAGYAELCNAIIRPPRARYSMASLGPKRFRFCGRAFKRVDFELTNPRGMALKCSHWEPDGWRVAEQLPCVVYLHGNSSARPEALPQLSLVLSLGATMLAFDCSGSGMSDGEYVSLGYWERDDLGAVIDHLRASGDVGAIALWGRSMGASTALLHGDRDPGIAAVVLDSAFADLTQLALEMVQRGRDAGLAVPRVVANIALRLIRASVSRAANFNIKDLCPIEHANQMFIPALFVAASGDDFIRPHHSKQIYDAYAGDKNLVLVDGDHNSQRPQFLHDSIYIFLQNYLRVPLEWALEGPDVMTGMPPWFASSFSALPDDSSQDLLYDADLLDAGFLDGHGMNPERQVEIQAALFQMLRQEQRPAGSGGGGGADSAAADSAADAAVAAAAPHHDHAGHAHGALSPARDGAAGGGAGGAAPQSPLPPAAAKGGAASASHSPLPDCLPNPPPQAGTMAELGLSPQPVVAPPAAPPAAAAGAIAAAARHDCRGVEIIEHIAGKAAPASPPTSDGEGAAAAAAAAASLGDAEAAELPAEGDSEAFAGSTSDYVGAGRSSTGGGGGDSHDHLLEEAPTEDSGGGGGSGGSGGVGWSCAVCTLINPQSMRECTACLTPRPPTVTGAGHSRSSLLARGGVEV